MKQFIGGMKWLYLRIEEKNVVLIKLSCAPYVLQVIFHCTVRTLDGVVVESTRLGLGGGCLNHRLNITT